jgi:hypothetical protein
MAGGVRDGGAGGTGTGTGFLRGAHGFRVFEMRKRAVVWRFLFFLQNTIQ